MSIRLGIRLGFPLLRLQCFWHRRLRRTLVPLSKYSPGKGGTTGDPFLSLLYFTS